MYRAWERSEVHTGILFVGVNEFGMIPLGKLRCRLCGMIILKYVSEIENVELSHMAYNRV
jgi:hypothetical protein